MENKKINKINKIEVLIIGLALFATYFGAGNLIFPSMLGLEKMCIRDRCKRKRKISTFR